VIWLLALNIAACEVERAPAGVTCEKLRSLKIGMTVESVRGLLGSPVQEVRQDGHVAVGGPEGTDMSWGWPSQGNGVRLYLYFGHERLLYADSWIRTMLRDLFNNEGRPVLFKLNSDGLQEGPDFQRIYCP